MGAMAVAIGESTLTTNPAFRPTGIDIQIAGGIQHTGIDHEGIGAIAGIASFGDVLATPDGLHPIGEDFTRAGRAVAIYRQSGDGACLFLSCLLFALLNFVLDPKTLQAQF